jgi:hypothetical protein
MIARSVWDQMDDEEKFSFLFRYLSATESQISDMASAIDLLRERVEKVERGAGTAP